jgi:hypothetical protein
MKRLFIILFSGFLLCSSLPTMAQSLNKLISVGFGFEGGVPVGNTASVYNFAGGITGRFALRAGHGFATFTAGGIAFIPQQLSGQNQNNAVQIPVKVGYKYIILRHLFVMGEVGYSSFRYYYEGSDNNLLVNRTGGFTYAPTVGVQFRVLELSARYETIQLNSGNVSYVGFRMGFNF